MRFSVVTIVGVGLIGGSIGMALKKRGLADVVRGLGRNRASLETARALGAIDEVHLEPATALRDAQFVVLCVPVDRIVEQALACASACPQGAILTDAGSTKARIAAGLAGRLPAGIEFIGSHPLAGSEKKGAENADPNLFVDRMTVLTPCPDTSARTTSLAAAFWRGLGSRTCELSPEDHDQVLALTSHLPHVAASALAGVLSPRDIPLTATGFRDTTRIAAGDPELWTAILIQNREAVTRAMRRFEARLADFRNAIETAHAATVDRLWREGKAIRDALEG